MLRLDVHCTVRLRETLIIIHVHVSAYWHEVPGKSMGLDDDDTMKAQVQ